MRIPLDALTDEQLQSADAVLVIDPRNGEQQFLYGRQRDARPATVHRIKVVEIEQQLDDEAQLRELRHRLNSVKQQEKALAARDLARKHFEVEPGMQRVIRFAATLDPDEQLREPIKLLEVNEATPASGILPLGFGAAPDAGIRFESILIEVTPTEYEQIEQQELKLPADWKYRLEEFVRPQTAMVG